MVGPTMPFLTSLKAGMNAAPVRGCKVKGHGECKAHRASDTDTLHIHTHTDTQTRAVNAVCVPNTSVAVSSL